MGRKVSDGLTGDGCDPVADTGVGTPIMAACCCIMGCGAGMETACDIGCCSGSRERGGGGGRPSPVVGDCALLRVALVLEPKEGEKRFRG